MDDEIRIGAAATALGVSIDTLRRWERDRWCGRVPSRLQRVAQSWVVALPAGTFTLDGHLVLRDNVKLIGAGTATVLKAGPRFLATQGPGGGYPLISTGGAVG